VEYARKKILVKETTVTNHVRKLSCLVTFGLLLIPLASAQSATFRATLYGKNQSPPITTPAHGTAVFTLSKSGKSLHYRLYVADIENASMAHIHIGLAGEEGPVAAWLYPSKPPAVVKKGEFTGVLAEGIITASSLMGPLQGKTIAALVDDIKAGRAYVNVHTTAHPAGEIRGQIK
jgi:hypothetical protein